MTSGFVTPSNKLMKRFNGEPKQSLMYLVILLHCTIADDFALCPYCQLQEIVHCLLWSGSAPKRVVYSFLAGCGHLVAKLT